MSKKIFVLASSAGGKSTLLRYLRKHTDFPVREMDEEVTKANNNEWPSDNEYKDQVLVPRITKSLIEEKQVIYLASYIPLTLIKEARKRGFKIVLLEVGEETLRKRNEERMAKEKYEDVSQWFDIQLSTYANLRKLGLIDTTIDGDQDVEKIAKQLLRLVDQGLVS